jgi:hypothetical protein
MNTKNIYFFPQVEQYSAYCRANIFLKYLKKTEPESKIFSVCHEQVKSILSYSDEIITIKKEKLKKETTYPKVLEEKNRNISNLFNAAINYINNTDLSPNKELLTWNDFQVCDSTGGTKYQDFMAISKKDLKDYDASSLGGTYIRDFKLIEENLKNGYTLKPTEKTFNIIKQKYGEHFNDPNTVCLITRNFKKKQPDLNTDIVVPNLKEFIFTLTENDIKVVNIGFPPLPMNLNNNYFEVNDALCQDELMSLFYLSKFVILNGYNGGYQTHALTNSNLIFMSEEFIDDFYIRGRKNNAELITEDFSKEIEKKEYMKNSSNRMNFKR